MELEPAESPIRAFFHEVQISARNYFHPFALTKNAENPIFWSSVDASLV
jgi:hypothetical protein